MVTDRQLARAGAGGGGGGGPTLAMSERHEQYWHTGAVTPATRSCRGAGEQLQIFSAVILSFRGPGSAPCPRPLLAGARVPRRSSPFGRGVTVES